MAEVRTKQRSQLAAEYRAKVAEAAQDQDGKVRETFRRLHGLGVPSMAVEALKGAKDTATMRAAKSFCSGPFSRAPALVLMGPPGTGKTTAAAEVLRDFAHAWDWNGQPSGITRQPCMFVEARRLTAVSEFNAEHQTWVEAMKNTRLLVLDDVGDEGTPSGRGMLTDIVLTRIDRGRRTVLTGNLLPEPLAQRYGAALFDRFRSVALMPNLFNERSMRGRT
jgi:DNA replication protein DnaC